MLANIDYIIDTLGEKEFNHSLSVLKKGGTMVSLKGVPNKEFAVKNNFTFFKRLLFTLAGKKYNKEAEKQDKKYKFLFVRADGSQLKKITEIIEDNNIKPLIDEHTYSLDNIDDALNLLAKGNIIYKNSRINILLLYSLLKFIMYIWQRISAVNNNILACYPACLF